MTKLYVGNLSFSTTEAGLRAAFEAHGQVASASIVMDRDTGRPRGFGFVEMPNDAEAQNAISKMDGATLDGRPLKVNVAKPKTGAVVAAAGVAVAAAVAAVVAVAAGEPSRSDDPR